MKENLKKSCPKSLTHALRKFSRIPLTKSQRNLLRELLTNPLYSHIRKDSIAEFSKESMEEILKQFHVIAVMKML